MWSKNETKRAAPRGFVRRAHLSECRLSPRSELGLGLLFLTLCSCCSCISVNTTVTLPPPAKVATQAVIRLCPFLTEIPHSLGVHHFILSRVFFLFFFFSPLKVRYLAIDFILANTVVYKASTSCQSWSVSATHTEIILKSDLQSL